jgi:hypothetical protein
MLGVFFHNVVHRDDLGTFILAVRATLIGAYGTFTFLVPLLQEPLPQQSAH